MTIRTILEIGLGALCAGSLGANVVWFRAWRRDQLAKDAARRLGAEPPANDIDGIVMPDPADPRWKQKAENFNVPGKPASDYSRNVLALGEISITDDGQVFIGAGKPVPNGEGYGACVLKAYRQRVATAAAKKSP